MSCLGSATELLYHTIFVVLFSYEKHELALLVFQTELDMELLKAFYLTSAGCFLPLCTAYGGLLAQEVIKALSGKFTPLKQWVSDNMLGGESPLYICTCLVTMTLRYQLNIVIVACILQHWHNSPTVLISDCDYDIAIS